MHKNTPIYELKWLYFNMSRYDFEEASVVMFVEDGEVIYFKHRYTGLTNI